jgi:hypothetical protein
MFQELSRMIGLSLDFAWEVVDQHYEDFGVILVRQLAGPAEDRDDDYDTDDPDGDEVPTGAP